MNSDAAYLSAPAVIVHGLGQARMVLGLGRPVRLVSAPGAGLYAGCGWWAALMALSRAAFPGGWIDLLDCADAPGAAMAALRAGVRGVILDGTSPGFPAVSAAARSAIVLPHRPACLDLAEPGAGRRLAAWLERDINTRLL